jgi:hypothetical protein
MDHRLRPVAALIDDPGDLDEPPVEIGLVVDG